MTPAEKYLEHLYTVFKREPEFYKNDSLIEGASNVTSIVYRDFPTIGNITAVTYGLSVVGHDEWGETRPELCICVESENLNWGIVIGYIANQLRGKSPFIYGNTIDFRNKVSEDSEMDAFLVFTPSIFEESEYLNIDVGLDYKINLTALYPLYRNEVDVLNRIGFEKFINHPNFDFYNLKRNPVTDPDN